MRGRLPQSGDVPQALSAKASRTKVDGKKITQHERSAEVKQKAQPPIWLKVSDVLTPVETDSLEVQMLRRTHYSWVVARARREI